MRPASREGGVEITTFDVIKMLGSMRSLSLLKLEAFFETFIEASAYKR